jgi:hypothetical protein
LADLGNSVVAGDVDGIFWISAALALLERQKRSPDTVSKANMRS